MRVNISKFQLSCTASVRKQVRESDRMGKIRSNSGGRPRPRADRTGQQER